MNGKRVQGTGPAAKWVDDPPPGPIVETYVKVVYSDDTTTDRIPTDNVADCLRSFRATVADLIATCQRAGVDRVVAIGKSKDGAVRALCPVWRP